MTESFRDRALALIRMDPRCVHWSRQPPTSSSDPNRNARFHFAEGFEEFETCIDIPVDLPRAPRGIWRVFVARAREAERARLLEEARDCAILDIVDSLDTRLSADEKQRLIALLEDVQTPD